METYHKIHAPFKRHLDGPNKGRLIEGDWSKPEFEYLANNTFEFTEKVDGTNIRIGWDACTGTVDFAGRTDKALIPEKLLEVLYRVFTPERFLSAGLVGNYTLYGEGYGPKIQNGGNYSDIQNFVLFDVTCDSINLCQEHQELLNVIQNESTSLKDSVSPVTTETLKNEIQNGQSAFVNKQQNTETDQSKKSTTPPKTESGTYALSLDSRKKSMTQCWQTSKEFVRYVERLRADVAKTEESCLSLSTIAMRQAEYADSYAKRVMSASTKQNSRQIGSTEPNCTCHKIGDWWLNRPDVDDIAKKLGIDSVPTLGYGTLYDGIELVKGSHLNMWADDGSDKMVHSRLPMLSKWGDFEAEGIVARPSVPMFNRKGERIITKIKGIDFK